MVQASRLVLSSVIAVVGLSGPPAHAQPVYSFVTINFPGAVDTFAQAVNNAGQTVGSFNDAVNVSHGFVRDSAGTFASFDFPGARSTFAADINAAGQVVGTYTDSANATHSYLRSSGAYSTLTYPGAFATAATGIDTAGQVVGYYLDSARNGHGFILSGGAYATIDGPGAASNFPAGINAGGQIVGNYLDASSSSVGYVRSTGGTFAPIAFPGAAGETDPVGVNALGVITGFYDDGTDFVGFILRDGAYSAFPQAVGFSETIPNKVNDLDQIAGTYTSADGAIHGFLGTPVPEPTSFTLLAVSSLAALWRSRRRLVRSRRVAGNRLVFRRMASSAND
jgi:hypothetical protein